ncbi:putative NUDIX hydrolase [bacterium BMS3Abin03]|nr:putative NUDIX hydrolase [bacterium BMS3Abin03]
MKNLLREKLKIKLKNKHGVLGKEKYFNSAVLVPLIKINDEWHLLFEKRANKIRQGGEVSFPGGEYDSKDNENFEETAIRETIEELGIDRNKIEIIGSMGTLITPMGVSVDPFVAFLKIKVPDELSIDKNEVEKIFTIPLSFFLNNEPLKYFVQVEVKPSVTNEKGETVELLPAKKFGLPERYSKPWRGGRHRILVYETDEETVWGITAELVFEFCKLLKPES